MKVILVFIIAAFTLPWVPSTIQWIKETICVLLPSMFFTLAYFIVLSLLFCLLLDLAVGRFRSSTMSATCRSELKSLTCFSTM